MIRLLLRLAGIRDYEVCQSCETLKQQLAYERAEKQKLTDTLLDIVKPKPITIPEQVVYTEAVKPVTTFSRRRAILEEEDRKNAHVLTNSKNLAMPDEVIQKTPLSFVTVLKTTEELEKELGVDEKSTEDKEKNG